MDFKCIPTSRKVRFFIALIAFVLTVSWIGNYWLLLGVPVIFDIYISRIVPWGAWKQKKEGQRPPAWVEWVDALVFALVAVYIINIFLFQNYKIPTSSLEKTLLVGDHLFVSKVSYGPRMPITPIAFPLVQNTFPITNSKSYTDWPTWDYKRLKGFGKVERNQIVVFNFPTGDTVPFYRPNPDYYITIKELGQYAAMRNPSLIEGKTFASEYEERQFFNEIGRRLVQSNPQEYGDVRYRPVDKRDNYVKRCIALPGDVFEFAIIRFILTDSQQKTRKTYSTITLLLQMEPYCQSNSLTDLVFRKMTEEKEEQVQTTCYRSPKQWLRQ